MYISSSHLLILVLGHLEFSYGFKNREKEEYMVRKVASPKLLHHFAAHFMIDARNNFCKNDIEHRIDFPTDKNAHEWQKHFERLEKGSFIYKHDTIFHLADSLNVLSYLYPMEDTKKALTKALDDIS